MIPKGGAKRETSTGVTSWTAPSRKGSPPGHGGPDFHPCQAPGHNLRNFPINLDDFSACPHFDQQGEDRRGIPEPNRPGPALLTESVDETDIGDLDRPHVSRGDLTPENRGLGVDGHNGWESALTNLKAFFLMAGCSVLQATPLLRPLGYCRARRT
jgi:hypothetical protein